MYALCLASTDGGIGGAGRRAVRRETIANGGERPLLEARGGS